MADKNAIEWTDATWNPVTGCTKISPGCAHCYAEAITLRFRRGGPYLPGKTTIRLHPDRLDDPGKWRSPRLVFVTSMNDLFHEEVGFDFVQEVFQRMEEYDRHTYQVLTKRPERMLEYVRSTGNRQWPENVWAGVSVENQHWADRRIPVLAQVPAGIRFLSVELLLKAVNLRPLLKDIHWVIVGGESGHRARPMHPDWARTVRDDCQEAGVPFFFKQWGGRTSKKAGRLLDGQTWDEMPAMSVAASSRAPWEVAHAVAAG